jgi:hypothetical protein
LTASIGSFLDSFPVASVWIPCPWWNASRESEKDKGPQMGTNKGTKVGEKTAIRHWQLGSTARGRPCPDGSYASDGAAVSFVARRRRLSHATNQQTELLVHQI